MKDEFIQIGGKSYKQCEVIMLPTEKSHLFYHDCDRKFNYKIDEYNECRTSICRHPQHLYILSSEEIKEGDWVFDSYDVCIYQIKDFTSTNYHQRKIIATTDGLSVRKPQKNLIINQKLKLPTEIIEELPRPSDDFIKAFVKAQGKGFDKVLVEYEDKGEVVADTGGRMLMGWYDGDDLPRKWQSDFQLKVAPDNTITIKPVQEVYVSEKALPFVIEGLGFNPLEEDFLGKEAIRYCKEKDYEGSAFYNVAMKAIEFGYQLAQKEIESEEKTSRSREEIEELFYQFGMTDGYSLPINIGERKLYLSKWLKENL